METDKLKTETVQVLTQEHAPISSADASYEKMEKVNISITVVEPYYTIISRVMFKEVSIGVVWEIYNSSELVNIYKKKNDPLRYWRRMRTE